MSPQNTLELVLLGALWGASFLFMRVASPEFGPVALIEVRVSVAAVLLFMLLAMRGKVGELRSHWRQLIVLGAINSAIPFTLFAFAVLKLPSGLTSVLNATAPLFGIVVAYFWFHQKQSRIRTIGLLVGFSGVVILVWNKLSMQGDALSLAAGLSAAILYGISANYSKHYLAGVEPLAVSCGSLTAASLLLAPLTIFQLPANMPSIGSWGCAIVLGVACTGIAYLLFFRLLKTLGVSRAFTVAYLIPVFGVLWGTLFLKEQITADMVVGGLVVLTGVGLVNMPDKKTI